MSKVIVIGGGAAGMMAAYAASSIHHDVILFDANDKLGKKIYITGKGRCNITNACDEETLFRNVVRNHKFLFSAFYTFNSDYCMELFKSLGLELKVERGNRVFPVSDHASDVTRVLEDALREAKVIIQKNCKITELICNKNNDELKGVRTKNGEEYLADAVIIATGGMSYQSTGSTGDGYRLAKKVGHKIELCQPGLVPLHVKEEWCKSLQGLSLKNIQVTIKRNGESRYQEFGEMIFTHFGVSGPIILSASSHISSLIAKAKQESLKLYIDLKPALDEDTLDKRILREWETCQNKQFKNSIGMLYPNKLIPVIIQLCGIDPDKKIHDITKEERRSLVKVTKGLELTIVQTAGFQEAIITQGGICTKEINPSTMESRLVKGLYFAGEVIDVDALTGGFNLQIAWSTGYLAGISIE